LTFDLGNDIHSSESRAKTFPQVLSKFIHWLKSYRYICSVDVTKKNGEKKTIVKQYVAKKKFAT
jgi:hypothetical protein